MRHIDPRSNTFRVVSRLLSPLESPEYIVMHTAETLEVSLPRLRLSFFVNKNWELECRSIPGYVIDKNQSCGTMFGLKQKLVLCPNPTRSEDPLPPRRLIIREGEIYYRKMRDRDFTEVWMHLHDYAPSVRWHEYTIDADLGRLTSNASLQSKLYQCYLHALTSHCLPDPLLGRTGTEEALCILRSAACRSFQKLEANEARLLQLIGQLSPVRGWFYSSRQGSVARVNWPCLPALSQHHDFVRTAHSLFNHARELEAVYNSLRWQPPFFCGDVYQYHIQLLLDRAAYRNNSYYPSDLQTSEQLSSLGDVEYRSRDVSDPRISQSEHVAFRTSWSIWNAQPSLDHTLPELWDLMSSWGSLSPAGRGISLRYSRYWLKFNVERDWFTIYNLCRKSEDQNDRNLRIKLSFSLSAAAYGQTKCSDIVPFLIIFALDKRCHNLRPPPNLSYTPSDGLVPELDPLRDLLFKSAFPISLTPVHSSKVEGTEVQDEELERKEEYDAAIREESLVVAESILLQWPHYQSVDFREQWFDKSACKQRIKKYIRSMSRNIQLREHVLQLQDILQDYEDVLIPASTPYVFSPEFTSGRRNAPSYSLRDIFSRANIPTPSPDSEPFRGCTIPSTSTAEGVSRWASSDSLEVLISELQQSRQPLLQLYGNELDKSHRGLLGQNASQSAHGAIPSHELLLLFRDECTQKKDQIFSEISAALAPSQNVEETSSIAGLWPRITPRSILHQLAHDRITTLPDRWKSLIMRYAVSFLRYQQSLRLLELSSQQKHEDLLREIETIRSDVLVESTPDWLLVQVRTLPR